MRQLLYAHAQIRIKIEFKNRIYRVLFKLFITIRGFPPKWKKIYQAYAIDVKLLDEELLMLRTLFTSIYESSETEFLNPEILVYVNRVMG